MARYTVREMAEINVGLSVEELAAQTYSAASRIEGVVHGRLRGNTVGVSLPVAREAMAKLAAAKTAVLEAMALLNVDAEV